MNAVADLDAPLRQLLGQFVHDVLRLGHRHAIARHDDHGARFSSIWTASSGV